MISHETKSSLIDPFQWFSKSIFCPHNFICVFVGRKTIIYVFSKFCSLPLALPLVPARYIRTFDVISEENCVLLRTKRRFKLIAPCPNFENASEVSGALPKNPVVVKFFTSQIFDKASIVSQLKAENILVHNGVLFHNTFGNTSAIYFCFPRVGNLLSHIFGFSYFLKQFFQIF